MRWRRRRHGERMKVVSRGGKDKGAKGGHEREAKRKDKRGE
jgi:hypothetical protein